MHPEIEELQSKLKEILYDCVVEIRATKGALYLFDPPSNRYELITEYGFRGALRSTADMNDPVVDRSGRNRTPFFVNGLMAEPRFSEILYESSTDRMLIAPVYQRGQLIGFVDMRDKPAKQAFDNTDVPKAQRIADRIGEQFVNKNVFGHRFIQLSTSGEPEEGEEGNASGYASPPAAPSPARQPTGGAGARAAVAAASAVASPPSGVAAPAMTGRIARASVVVIQARAAAEAVLRASITDALSDSDVPVIREMLRLILLIPGAVATAFSAVGQLGGYQEIASRATLAPDALETFQSRLNTWLQKHGEKPAFARNTVQPPANPQEPATTAAQIARVFTAQVVAGSVPGLYLSVAFAADPDRVAHDLLATFHRQLQSAIEHSVQGRTGQTTRRRIADRLVEPDFMKFPELRRHTEAVLGRVGAFGRFLHLSAEEIENAEILAIVHDVGMRLLDYDRLYRKRDLTHDEMQMLRNHTTVGAVLVEPYLGAEIARAVLSHHERWDGGGYPNDLRGNTIPILSRMMQICDVYETMVAPDGYQPQQTHDQAMLVISRGGGTQFDPDLAGRFVEMMRTAR